MEEKIENYIAEMPQRIGNHNTKLLINFIKSYKSLPSAPTDQRVLLVLRRLSSISKMIKNKPLDSLTENDLQDLNLAMREKMMLSSQDYRKTLKQFLKLLDKKKYFDLIDSYYLKAPQRKANEKPLVDPSEFWEQSQMEAYIQASAQYSPRQLAWAGLWLTTGCRPNEILTLTKKDLEYRDLMLLVRVNGKTGKRTIVLNKTEAPAIWNYLQPHLNTLKNEEKIFTLNWEQQDRIHKQLCNQINLPQHKSRKLYIARKMNLTRFYNTYGLVKASSMAGHVAGSKAMKHYVALTEEQLTDQQLAKVELKICPNPCCSATNEPHFVQCFKCGSPLNKKQFSDILQKNVIDLIDARLDLAKQDLLLKAVEVNGLR